MSNKRVKKVVLFSKEIDGYFMSVPSNSIPGDKIDPMLIQPYKARILGYCLESYCTIIALKETKPGELTEEVENKFYISTELSIKSPNEYFKAKSNISLNGFSQRLEGSLRKTVNNDERDAFGWLNIEERMILQKASESVNLEVNFLVFDDLQMIFSSIEIPGPLSGLLEDHCFDTIIAQEIVLKYYKDLENSKNAICISQKTSLQQQLAKETKESLSGDSETYPEYMELDQAQVHTNSEVSIVSKAVIDRRGREFQQRKSENILPLSLTSQEEADNNFPKLVKDFIKESFYAVHLKVNKKNSTDNDDKSQSSKNLDKKLMYLYRNESPLAFNFAVKKIRMRSNSAAEADRIKKANIDREKMKEILLDVPDFLLYKDYAISPLTFLYSASKTKYFEKISEGKKFENRKIGTFGIWIDEKKWNHLMAGKISCPLCSSNFIDSYNLKEDREKMAHWANEHSKRVCEKNLNCVRPISTEKQRYKIHACDIVEDGTEDEKEQITKARRLKIMKTSEYFPENLEEKINMENVPKM